ncbi:MAG: hypothetical protein H5U01_14950, partial [Clostridia bacterium]|nr:hypothetical protein [Clostridia bacterium]
ARALGTQPLLMVKERGRRDGEEPPRPVAAAMAEAGVVVMPTTYLAARCAGAVGIEVGVLALRKDRGATVEAIVQEAGRLAERRAEVIVLGCTGMAELAREVAGRLGTPVLEPLAVTLNLADLVARARQGQSR